MYRVTVEQFTDKGWQTVAKTTDPKSFLTFINMSQFAKLFNLTRAQLRYRLKKL
ncbi:hypothetical protein RYR53_004289 [Aeromonas hydrophila]|nr:hypothetical protein [Aeromonas hydrophila]RRA91573.1 hypothetical protein AVS_12735 [Aeromonas veronii bv. sobria]BCO13583.1 hypothetical protein RIMD111065_19390 [Aeromonas hydrophila]